ncbi:hypothetical protein [Achromobacter sp. 79A6]|jgi:hypothetical protein|uniref:hypothetical protein n=1 Tax=unclassified Achromobacter TaxID=2626865 RepID=UPI0021F101D2
MACLTLSLVACGSAQDASKGNFGKAIQTYLDKQHGLCAAIPAKTLPFTLANQDIIGRQTKKLADSLVEAGLLSPRNTETQAMFGNKMEPATEYQITDLGKKYLVANAADTFAQQDAFCTGKYAVVEVDNFTQPSDAMGMKISQVNFRYKAHDVADWAKSESLRANYKNFADQAEGDIKAKAVLILTNDGWMHERLFKH